MKQYDFIHGVPSIKYIKFSNQSCNFNYKGINIRGSVTLHLIPSGRSSISIKSNLGSRRIYHSGLGAQRSFSHNQEFDKSLTEYKIGNSKDLFKYYTQSTGLGLYQSSFDLYGFITSLMINQSFRNNVKKDQRLFKFWKSLFDPLEFDDLMLRIESIKQELSFDQLLDILSNYKLKLVSL